jgi:gamma-glutamylcyclotransferase (GGCT)/AIG2-like uncharacterized protein YtfP
MSSYVFLYGTLLPGHAPEEIAPAVRKLRRLGEGTVHGVLYDLGKYPGAVLDKSAGARIHGTVFELPDDEALLSALDAYEDFAPGNEQASLFVRTLQPVTLVDGEILQCWIYVYNRDVSGARRIPGGRYAP